MTLSKKQLAMVPPTVPMLFEQLLSYDATGFSAAGLDPLTNNVGNNGNFNQFEGLDGDDTFTSNFNTRAIYTNAAAAVTVTLGAGGTGSGQWHGTGRCRQCRQRHLHQRRE